MRNAHDEKDDFLKDLLQSAGTESTSPDFLANVMAQVEVEAVLQSKRSVAPVISLKGWLVMALGLVATIMIAVLFPSTSTKPLPGQEFMANSLDKTADFFGNLHFSSILVMAVGIVALLFAIERLLMSRNEH